MLNKIKRKLGYIKRGVHGYWQNKIDKFAPVPNGFVSFEIGKSVKGAEIRCFKIGNGKQKLLHVFGIHGNEIGTVKLGHRFLKWASENVNKINNFTLYIVPCLNPDGLNLARKQPDYFAGGKTGRLNANNVDLNRNFETKSFQKESVWNFGKNFSEQSKVYCGERGNSEPETKALTSFIYVS